METITEQLDALVSSSKEEQAIDECEGKLGSNATLEKDIPDDITVPALRRENAIIKEASDSHRSLSWTGCYDDACWTHLGNSDSANSSKPKSQHRSREKSKPSLC